MPSLSCANLLDLAAGGPDSGRPAPPRLPRVMTSPGILADFDLDDGEDISAMASPTPPPERRIIVSHRLPLRATSADPGTAMSFSWDLDALHHQLRRGLPEPREVFHVGTLPFAVPAADQDDVSSLLLDRFRCAPVFLPADLHHKFYQGFCKRYLWPLLHSLLPPTSRFDRSFWRAFLAANRLFADRVLELLGPDGDDVVWAHDYHLLALPTFLRRRSPRLRLGFFLHSPFPSSEIFRALPVCEELLRTLLNADLLGFHTFDYARHFLSCCSRMLGLHYGSKRGHLSIEYYGRTVTVKILPAGIDVDQIQSVIKSTETEAKVTELLNEYHGKVVFVGADDMDPFKGIALKFLAFEQMLINHPILQGQAVLVQIANPARSQGKEIQEVQDEVISTAKRINEKFSSNTYQPIVLINRFVPTYEKAAYYAIAECCIVNAVRDGMNLVPYKYTMYRQGSPALDGSPKKSMIVVSEFIGCSPSLSGAIRVNPFNVDAVADALHFAISMPETEKQMRHEKNYKYVSTHDVVYWARCLDQDLQRACKDHYLKRCWGIGFGMNFRVVALAPNFRKLSVECIASAYRKTNSRLLLLDYDGTMLPQASIDKTPSEEVLSVIDDLCADPKNVVFLVSGRGRDSLGCWFARCQKLGIAAEHGYYIRWTSDSSWESCLKGADFDWKNMAEPVMRHYTEATDGSYIESKESALVWHHQDADPDFGSWQAKELLDHLESVLANEPVVVKRGQHIVEVIPQGVSKGVAVENLISSMSSRGKPPEFVLCVGDDRSDEDMFEVITGSTSTPSLPANTEIFACTVGKKPSKAKYYLDDTVDVIKLLQGLAIASSQPSKPRHLQVSFEGSL